MEQTLQNITSQNNLAVRAERVQACRSSGQSVCSWCAENGIVPNTYFRWQKKVFDAMNLERSQFYEVSMPASRRRADIIIEFNGVTAQVFQGADEGRIQAVLQAMRSC